MISKLSKHLRVWNTWRKRNRNGSLHHVLVLLGIIKSPTFMVARSAYAYDVHEAFIAGLNNSVEEDDLK